MHRVGLKTSNTEEEPSRATRLCSVQYKASREHIHVQWGPLYYCVVVVLDFRDPNNHHLAGFPTSAPTVLQPWCGLNVRVGHILHLRTSTLPSPARTRLLPHLIRTVPEHTGTVPKNNLLKRT